MNIARQHLVQHVGVSVVRLTPLQASLQQKVVSVVVGVTDHG